MVSKAPPIPFQGSRLGTLGVEMEWLTVDLESGQQVPAAPELLGKIGSTPRIKAELFTSVIEINTEVHTSLLDCMNELRRHHHRVSSQLLDQGAAILASGTHPFSRWQEQRITNDARYHRLVHRLQWMARRFNICGIHVHVGMPSGDRCIHCLNNLLPVMPAFLAISANSPFWTGYDTGLSSCRLKIFEGLSQGGMPFYFADWRDFEHCVGRLIATGSIDSIRDIWWEMRPHPDFGTLEVRIGDMPAYYEDAAAYIALVRAEAVAAANRPPLPRVHPSLIRENRWRACRYGCEAILIEPESEQLIPVLDWIETRISKLIDFGADAGDLEWVRDRIVFWRREGDGARRQRRIHAHASSPGEMIKQMRVDGWS